MVDYLETAGEENLDALLEQLLRLSAALSGIGSGKGERTGGEDSPRRETFEAQGETEDVPPRAPLGQEESREEAGGFAALPSPRPARTEGDTPFPDSPWREERKWGLRLNRLKGRRTAAEWDGEPSSVQAAPRSETAERSGGNPGPEEEKDGETPSTLLEQLEQTERALALRWRGEAEGAERRKDNFVSQAVRAGWSESAPPGFAAGGPAADSRNGPRRGTVGSRSLTGGDIDWAERADKAFRRDGRRYDGGFYLY